MQQDALWMLRISSVKQPQQIHVTVQEGEFQSCWVTVKVKKKKPQKTQTRQMEKKTTQVIIEEAAIEHRIPDS